MHWSLSSLFNELFQDIVLISKYFKRIRIHDSGDFFNVSYTNLWIELVKNFPKVRFYAYTKSIPYFINNYNFLPKNLKIIFSYGGKFDNLIDPEKHFNAKIFQNENELNETNYLDCSKSDLKTLNSKKYNIGNEMSLQLKKSLVYFDDAEKDLNINMYSENKKIFETLKKEDWQTIKRFFVKKYL